MTALRPANEIQSAFLAVCRAELTALKPGNVHIHAAGHGMELHHFEDAAEAAAPCIAETGTRVGARIRSAVDASVTAAGCNTNLGIVILCAPLAAAAGDDLSGDDLRARLSTVLAGLGIADAQDTYAAIRRANPAGLGRTSEADVATTPRITLLQAMRLSAARDRIARAFVTNFEDIFEIALPALRIARRQAASPQWAVTTLHMRLLAEYPDTHIMRKFGVETALRVQQKARGIEEFWVPVAGPTSLGALMDLDRDLKSEGINPGTTADMVVATLFAEALEPSQSS